MKRFIGLFVATIAAFALPLSAAGASSANPKPAEYQQGCDQLYHTPLQPGFDAFIKNAHELAQTAEKTFCGENKYAK